MKRLLLSILTIILLFSCQTTNRVTRIDPSITTDLSGRWNDTDSRLVSEEIVNDLINRDFYNYYDGRPVMIVGNIQNRSSEHIDTSTFIKDIERDVINSGKFRVVASASERYDIRAEKEDQQSYASIESAKRLANETGADMILIGNISTIKDQLDGTRVIFYQIDLELIDLETTEKLWIGSKKHKKVIELGGTKW